MAAVSLLKYPGSGNAPQGHAPTADDVQFNSLGIGKAANGTRGTLDFGTAARSAVIQLNDGTGALDFTGALLYTFNTALRGPDGSLAAPAFSFTTQTTTGLRLAAASDMRMVVAGTDILTMTGSTLQVSGRMGVNRAAASTIALAVGGAQSVSAEYVWSYLYDGSTFTTDTNVTLQRFARVAAGVISAGVGVTVTDAATFYIDGAPTISGGGALSNPYSLLVAAGTSRFLGVAEIETATLPVLSATRTSAGTNTALVGTRLTHKTTANMVDGLAVGLSFAVQDDTSANETLAAVYGRRSGADNTGRLDFYVSAAGVQNRRWSILDTGEFVAAADNAVDIGQTGAVRPRQVYLAAPPAQTDSAVRADEAAIPVGAAAGTLTSAGGATKYSGPYTTQPNTTETSVSFLVPHAMVLRNLRVRAQAAPTGASVLFTAFVNELANTALEVDYLTTSSGTVSDTVGSITLAAGDRLSIKIVMNTGYTDNSMTDVRWSLDATRL